MPLRKEQSLETILVVENEPVVLDSIRSILEHAGFYVLTAANSSEAIQVEGNFHSKIHLLLSDVMMPDMSGAVISRLIKKDRLEMRVMLMSGCSGGGLFFLNHGWQFVEQPSLAADLIQRVEEALRTPNRCQGDDGFGCDDAESVRVAELEQMNHDTKRLMRMAG